MKANQPNSLQGLRITRRGKAVAVAVTVLTVLPLLGARPWESKVDAGPLQVTVHTVAPGETLWGFARSIARPGADLRDVVEEIRVLNELPNVSLQVGQSIVLPVAKTA